MITHTLIAHAVMARLGTRIDGKNPEPSLTVSASTARGTSTTFSDKLTFPDEPTSSTRATSTSTIKYEEKEKPRYSDSGQEVERGRR